METENRDTDKSRTWLVVGLVLLVIVAVIVAQRFHSDETTDLLRQEGMPAARQGMQLSQEGKKLLPLEEQQEMDAIYAEAFKALTANERQRFMVLAQQGTRSTDSEIAESAALLEKALTSLPAERGARLWALVSKAVALAQEQSERKTDASPAYAEKTYTPAQLRDMVQSGNYPKQGTASTQTKSADYASCIAQIEAIVSSVGPSYPTQTIVSTNLMRTEKIWTNDAAMTLTCSAPDKKLIITTAPYL